MRFDPRRVCKPLLKGTSSTVVLAASSFTITCGAVGRGDQAVTGRPPRVVTPRSGETES